MDGAQETVDELRAEMASTRAALRVYMERQQLPAAEHWRGVRRNGGGKMGATHQLNPPAFTFLPTRNPVLTRSQALIDSCDIECCE